MTELMLPLRLCRRSYGGAGPVDVVDGQPEDAGVLDIDFENEGEGYCSCQSFIDGSVGEPFDPRPGISLKGVLDFKAAARMAQLETKTVG
jgi:hypothetical protein